MHVRRETVAALILLIAGGCGGGGNDAEGSTLAAVEPCLARLAKTTPVHGGVAEGAADAVRLRLPSSVVTVLFAADADAASTLAERLRGRPRRPDPARERRAGVGGRAGDPRRGCGRGVHQVGRALSYAGRDRLGR